MTRIITACLSLLLAVAINPLYAAEVGEPAEDVGTSLDLPGDLTLQLSVEDQLVVAYFVDKDGLIAESTADSILIVVDEPGHRNDEWRAVLKQGSDARMTTSHRLFPTYRFHARVILRLKEGEPKSFPSTLLELDRNVK